MSVPILQFIATNKGARRVDGASEDNRAAPNAFGETPLAFAPTIGLENGELAVPQQYLEVQRNLDNLSNVLSLISTPEAYQLFAGQTGSNLFLTVGVFGRENYPASVETSEQVKIVYGRKWLIEDATPTSEIVQTAMLAVKKAREHEVRELLTLRVNDGRRLATPFNCHLDLPLMAGNPTEFDATVGGAIKPITDVLGQVRIAGRALELIAEQVVGSKLIVELKLTNSSSVGHFPELERGSLTVVCDSLKGCDFLHQLCKAVISASDRFVEESVSFNGFNRFSHSLCVERVANFSYQTRNIAATDSRFDTAFTDMSYRVDVAKAPNYNDGLLGRQQRAAVAAHPGLAGYLPR